MKLCLFVCFSNVRLNFSIYDYTVASVSCFPSRTPKDIWINANTVVLLTPVATKSDFDRVERL